jgi:hypothetical protein
VPGAGAGPHPSSRGEPRARCRRGRDGGLGPPPPTVEPRPRRGIAGRVRGRTARQGRHLEGLAPDAGQPLVGAEGGPPGPGQATGAAPDPRVPGRCTRRQARRGGRLPRAVEPALASLVEQAQVQRARVQGAAAVTVVGRRRDTPAVSAAVAGEGCPGASRPTGGVPRRGPQDVSRAWRRLPPASARASLPLPAAAQAWRCYDCRSQELAYNSSVRMLHAEALLGKWSIGRGGASHIRRLIRLRSVGW